MSRNVTKPITAGAYNQDINKRLAYWSGNARLGDIMTLSPHNSLYLCGFKILVTDFYLLDECTCVHTIGCTIITEVSLLVRYPDQAKNVKCMPQNKRTATTVSYLQVGPS